MFENVRSGSRRLLGLEDQQEPPPEEDGWGLGEVCPSLSYKERVWGFVGCMTVGFFLTFGSFFRIVQLVSGNPIPFITYKTLGDLTSLTGSFFLWGPMAQLKSMFEKVRVVATVVYLATLVLGLALALVHPFPAQSLVLIVLVVCQYAAYLYYSLSYIPFAQRWLISACMRLCGDD